MQRGHPFSARRSVDMKRGLERGRATHIEDQDAPEYAADGL